MAGNNPLHARTIRLADEGGRLVLRRGRSPEERAEPLPRVPLTLVHWCGLAAERFFQRQHRCLLIALLLDTTLRRWTFAIPAQRCSRYVARWDGPADNYLPSMPAHLLIAGSFQSAPPGHITDAMYLPPHFDGVHLVAQRRSGRRPRRGWVFVRREQELSLGDPAVLIGDDIDQALRDAADRIQLDD
jgi:hypothetical protein